MNLYSVALFLHIVGALLLVAILTIEGYALRQGTSAARVNSILGPISALFILVPGLYMVATQWGWTGWVVTGIAGWVLIAAVGAFTGISVMRGRLSFRAATLSWLVRIGMALALVFVMTVKPGLAGSVVSVVIGGVLGASAGLARIRQVRPA